MKVLILGATGMLGNAVTRFLANSPGFDVVATARSTASVRLLPASLRAHIVEGIDVENVDAVIRLLGDVRPDIVINCVGLIKQLEDSNNPLAALPINALQPHRLARLCALGGARFIHISTDYVFTGARGNYNKSMLPDATDLYGRSKLLGEVDYHNAVTLRTSIIGHELNSCTGLIDWFLSQKGTVKGFTGAIFSGLPTVELARVIRDHVITRPDLRGLYHVSATAITKYDLLMLVREVYAADIGIIPDGDLEIDRSLEIQRASAKRPAMHRPYGAISYGTCTHFDEVISVMYNGKTLLITGGTGSFGNAVLRRFIDSDLAELRIFVAMRRSRRTCGIATQQRQGQVLHRRRPRAMSRSAMR